MLRALTVLVVALSVVWSLAVVATVLHVHRAHSELADLAQEVAHHHAHEGGEVSRHYLDLRLRHLTRPIIVRSASIRTIRHQGARAVEVRLMAVVGSAFGGHPKLRISVVRFAPVEAGVSLP